MFMHHLFADTRWRTTGRHDDAPACLAPRSNHAHWRLADSEDISSESMVLFLAASLASRAGRSLVSKEASTCW